MDKHLAFSNEIDRFVVWRQLCEWPLKWL